MGPRVEPEDDGVQGPRDSSGGAAVGLGLMRTETAAPPALDLVTLRHPRA